MNNLLIKSIVIIVLSNVPLVLKSQKTFNVIPVIDGEHSELLDVHADSNFIYVIGESVDTSLASTGQIYFAWWGVFDYDGQLITQKKIIHENLTNQIGVYGSRLLRRANGNFIYVPIIYNEDGNAECLVLEIESSTGNLINHSVIGNAFDPNSYLSPGWVTHDPYQPGNILLATNLQINDIQRLGILTIGRQLQVRQSILIDDNGRNNYSVYMEKETDSTYLVIGESRKRNDMSEGAEVKPFFMRVNADGEILTFNLATGIPDKSVGFFLTENISVTRDVNGNWIFAAHSFFPGWHSIPYVFSYDAEFKNMNWAINFSADPGSAEQQHLLFGADYDESNGTYVVVGEEASHNESYIIKTNDAGDSLWTRHFIPLNWQPEDFGFAGLIDIEATPYHSYVSVGRAVGRPDYMRRSWVILVDEYGCIVPGCQNVVSNNEISETKNELFSVYPNPASDFVGLLCNQAISDKIKVSVFDASGKIMESVNVSPVVGYQYILNVEDWMSGMYVLKIESIDGRLLQVAQIVVD